MAFAGVASLSYTIALILKYHQDSISDRFKNQITSLHKHIIFLQSFLEDSPDEARTWEERMREVTNEAEDIIELLLSNSAIGSSNPKFKKGRYEFCYDFDELVRVTEKIESIVKGVKERHKESACIFNDDSMQIIGRLCGGPPGLQVIPIVGVGGIGKTTLARNVYNHPLIVSHFEILAWVTTSQNYSLRETISGLLLSSKNFLISKNMSDEELFPWLSLMLSGQRYLIVLDDLWSVEIWDQLEPRINHNFNGSRVLVTKRLIDVAESVSFYSSIHHMYGMDVDQSWNMLRQKIFERDRCPPKLEYIGKMIAGSCRGNPLAIEVVSGILAAHQTEDAWEDVEENVKTAINCEHYEHTLHLIHLSYTYLPHHLRPCFLYLGIFPEDHEIRISKLIKLWEAEGFINESGCKSFEETGKEHLEDLVKRSLVSVRKRKSNGRIKSVAVHDLVWDFCTRQAQVDSFFLHVTKFLATTEAVELHRRVSVVGHDNILKNVNGSTVRTMICLEDNRQGIRGVLEYFRLLRILDFSEPCYLSNELSNQVYEQFHLRYLAFTSHDLAFTTLPKSISNLENLQTLIIRPGDYTRCNRVVVKLPVEIWRMPQLRHILVVYCELPSQEKEATFALENLQTLNQAQDFICSREIVEMIPNLKKLGIANSKGWGYCQPHNLVYFQKLEILKMEKSKMFEILPRKRNFIFDEWHRIRPAFPPTLKKLSLRSLGVPWEDMNIVSSLPNLQVLKLRDYACIGSTWETNEGGFSQLKFLLINRSDLEYWITESSHFPRLKRLVIHRCPHLTVGAEMMDAKFEHLESLEVNRNFF